MTEQSVAHCIGYKTTQQDLIVQPVLAAQRKYPAKLVNLLCNPIPEEHTAMLVLGNETGESLEYIQIFRHPKYKEVWNTSYSNELERLCQGVSSGTTRAKKQRVKGTETFQVIKFKKLLTTFGSRYVTLVWCVRSDIKRTTPIVLA